MVSRIIDIKRDRPVIIFASLTLICAAVLGFVGTGPLIAYLAVIAAAALAVGGRAIFKNFGSPKTAALSSQQSSSQARAVAHDLRTQISIILLQLNKVQDPRVRAAEDDLKDLAETIENIFSADKTQNLTDALR